VSEPQIVTEEDLLEESNPSNVELHSISGEEAQSSSTESASSSEQQDLHREHKGPDDDGSITPKYGAPARIHPGGDFTLKLKEECPLFVFFDGVHEFFRPGNVLPTDIWDMNEQGVPFLRRGHATCHLSDGRIEMIPTNSPLPFFIIEIKKHNPALATLSHEEKPDDGDAESVTSGDRNAPST